jgi:hypothetical protein
MSATIHTLPTAALSKETVKEIHEGSLGQGSFAALVQAIRSVFSPSQMQT